MNKELQQCGTCSFVLLYSVIALLTCTTLSINYMQNYNSVMFVYNFLC